MCTTAHVLVYRRGHGRRVHGLLERRLPHGNRAGARAPREAQRRAGRGAGTRIRANQHALGNRHERARCSNTKENASPLNGGFG